MNIEALKLCVQVVDYPQQKIDRLEQQLSELKSGKYNEFQVYDTCSRLGDMLSKADGEVTALKKELASTNLLYEAYQDNYENLSDEHNKLQNQYKDLDNNYALMTDNRNQYHELYADVHSTLTKERILTNETLMAAQHWKKQYEELLVKHAKVLEELEQNKVTTQELIGEFNRVITQLYMGNLTALVLHKL